MPEKHRKQWEALGTSDPYWAVLSDSDKRDFGWDSAEFFETGIEEISNVYKKLDLMGVRLNFELALDYGCGVGRLSRALATSFQRVLGIDFSESMLLEARSVNTDIENITFLCNNGYDLADVGDASVDFIYSSIVLQHSPAKIQCLLIREFCRVLRPGGILVFQTPSHQKLLTIGGFLHFFLGNTFLNLASRIRHGKSSVMEMHNVRRGIINQILKEEEVSILEEEQNDAAGTAFVSYLYFAKKC